MRHCLEMIWCIWDDWKKSLQTSESCRSLKSEDSSLLNNQISAWLRILETQEHGARMVCWRISKKRGAKTTEMSPAGRARWQGSLCHLQSTDLHDGPPHVKVELLDCLLFVRLDFSPWSGHSLCSEYSVLEWACLFYGVVCREHLARFLFWRGSEWSDWHGPRMKYGLWSFQVMKLLNSFITSSESLTLVDLGDGYKTWYLEGMVWFKVIELKPAKWVSGLNVLCNKPDDWKVSPVPIY